MVGLTFFFPTTWGGALIRHAGETSSLAHLANLELMCCKSAQDIDLRLELAKVFALLCQVSSSI